MRRTNFLRFPSDKEAEKYQYTRTSTIVGAIVVSLILCLLFLAMFAIIHNSILLTLAGISAGVTIALWFLTKPDPDEDP